MAVQRSIRQVQHGVMAVLLGEIGIVEQYIDSANGRRDLLQRVIGSKPSESESYSKRAGCRRCEQSGLCGVEERELIEARNAGSHRPCVPAWRRALRSRARHDQQAIRVQRHDGGRQ